MKQVFQDLEGGDTLLLDVPRPSARTGHVVIHSQASLLSAGTERMLLEFGRANLLDKARQQPEKVLQVLDKVRTDGLFATLEVVRDKLAQPMALGYSNAGVVLEVGAGVADLSVGDRVISNGPHAEIVSVPRNLCAAVPDGVSDETAAFTVVGAIAMQSVRLAQPGVGELFVVSGLGLVGLLAVQILRASGCRVLGIDFDSERIRRAGAAGAHTVNLGAGEDPIGAAQELSGGRGVDGVIIAASTDSDEPVHQAAQMCRQRGRIVLVGVVGLKLRRADFYDKELSFQVSCSYGPGRYDPEYEDKGRDYPFGFVRWTQQRNFEAVLGLMADGKIQVEELLTHRYAIADACKAYGTLGDDSSALGILLTYPQKVSEAKEVIHRPPDSGRIRKGEPTVGVIGAGAYAQRILFPALLAANASLEAIASSGGASAALAARRFGAARSTTDVAALLADDRVNMIVIATRHDSHAELVCQALDAGKHVFVEKPLALTAAQLDRVSIAYTEARNRGQLLTVGFNRRFAPLAVQTRKLLSKLHGPKAMVATINAGALPADHWARDPSIGGGRFIGEGCHFVDLLRFFANSPVISTTATTQHDSHGQPTDSLTCSLQFEDGSTATVHYLDGGHKSFPKERFEIFCAGRIIQLDNFRRLRAFGLGAQLPKPTLKQDKGQRQCVASFVAAVRDGRPEPIPFEQLVEVTRATFDAVTA